MNPRVVLAETGLEEKRRRVPTIVPASMVGACVATLSPRQYKQNRAKRRTYLGTQ